MLIKNIKMAFCHHKWEAYVLTDLIPLNTPFEMMRNTKTAHCRCPKCGKELRAKVVGTDE